ncbi:GTPase family protein [Breznakiellaceae bacterium SP9]
MSGLSVTVVRKSSIDELIGTAPQFSFLKNSSLPKEERLQWNMSGSTAYCLQVMFIGKTGYGKSSTLNRICRQRLFETDDIMSCTKQLFSAEYRLTPSGNDYFSLCDLPGIGESIDADKEYRRLYAKMLKKSSCVVYVFRADQRDFSDDELTINSLIKEHGEILPKLVAAVNYADKIEPVTRITPFQPNYEQQRNLEKRVQHISNVLSIPHDKILNYSATEGYNFTTLLEKIAILVKQNLYGIKKSLFF